MNTAARIERQLRLHTYPVLGHRTLRDLAQRPSLAQAWTSGLGLAPSSARQVIRDVSSVFIAAIDDGPIGRPLQAKSVSRPKLPEAMAEPWTLEQVAMVSAALPPCYAVLTWLGAGAGMRQGEIFGLAAEDVDFLRRVIHVRRQVRLVAGVRCFAPVKNDKAHAVPLADALAPVLAEHIRLHPPVTITLPWLVPDGRPVTAALLVTTQAGGALHRHSFNGSFWQPARRKAGIADHRANGMHALRHTAASAWLGAGVSIAAVASWLGDTQQSVLATYAHLMPSDIDRGREAMDAFLTGPVCALDVPAGGAL